MRFASFVSKISCIRRTLIEPFIFPRNCSITNVMHVFVSSMNRSLLNSCLMWLDDDEGRTMKSLHAFEHSQKLQITISCWWIWMRPASGSIFGACWSCTRRALMRAGTHGRLIEIFWSSRIPFLHRRRLASHNMGSPTYLDLVRIPRHRSATVAVRGLAFRGDKVIRNRRWFR